MILNTQDLLSFGKTLKKNQSYAFYRLPKENKIYFIAQNTTELLIANEPEELNDKKGFVIAPFKQSAAAPICLITPDIEKVFSLELSHNKDEVDYSYVGTCEDKYRKYFNLFKEQLLNNRFDKLVLSRSHTQKPSEVFDAIACFTDACHRYPNSYVYLCYTPHTGLWMGCSPEILLSANDGKWRTVALAGTQSMPLDVEEMKWDDKNLEEQAYVSTYIRTQLNTIGVLATEKGPYTMRAARLAHLRTDFEFTLPADQNLGTLLRLLHPTPAVCGVPKTEAYRFIVDNEGYNRKYYSGFVGMINPESKTDLYVNLRCVSIDNDGLTFYAGSGLLAASNLEDEWVETEKKMCTMKNIINL